MAKDIKDEQHIIPGGPGDGVPGEPGSPGGPKRRKEIDV